MSAPETEAAPRVEAKLLYRRLDALFGGLDPSRPQREVLESFLEEAFRTLREDLRLRAAFLFAERRDGFLLIKKVGDPGLVAREDLDPAEPPLQLLFRHVIAERLGTIILSVLVAHTAWHWTWDRYNLLVQYQFVWPVIDAAFLAIAVRWLMVLVVLVGAWWVIRGLIDEKDDARQGKVSET